MLTTPDLPIKFITAGLLCTLLLINRMDAVHVTGYNFKEVTTPDIFVGVVGG